MERLPLTMMPKPYVGITGITTTDEAKEVVQQFEATGFTPEGCHTGMLGFAVNNKALTEGRNAGRRYLQNIAILEELTEHIHEKALPMIHYTSANPDSFAEHVITMFRNLYDNKCSALQINDPSPSPKEVHRIKERFPDMTIVLSIQDDLIRQGHEAVVMHMMHYREAINYALIDPSLGQGRDMDLDRAIGIHKAIQQDMPEVTTGFAGGFCGDNVTDRLLYLRSRIDRNFCIDAEGKLRNDNDELIMQHVQHYLRAASQGL